MAKDSPKLEQLLIAASILTWSILCFVAPEYLAITGAWRVVLNFLGVVFGVVALAGALISASDLYKNEGFSFMGAAMVFALPSGILFLVERYSKLGSPWTGLARSSVLLLAAVAGPFIGLSIAHFLEPETEREVTAAQKKTRRRRTVETSLVAILGLATAAVNLVRVLGGDS